MQYYALFIIFCMIAQITCLQLPCVQKATFKTQGYPIALATEKTFLFCQYLSEKRDYRYQHVKLDGQVLAETQLTVQKILFEQMIDQNRLLVVSQDYKSRSCDFQVWDLSEKNFVQIKTVILEMALIRVFWFPLTKLICYIQCSQKSFKLSYFQIDLHNQFQICGQFPSSMIQIMKLNEHSMIGIFSQPLEQLSKPFSLQIYSLNSSLNQIENRALQPRLPFSQLKYDFLFYRISDIWEATPSVLYIQTQVKADLDQYQQSKLKEEFDSQKQQRYHNFYYNYNEATAYHGIDISTAHRVQFINSMRDVDYIQEGYWTATLKTALNSSQQTQSQNLLAVPIYYVEPDSKNILAVTPAVKSIWSQRLKWNHSLNKMMKTIRYQNIRESQIQVFNFPCEWCIYKYGLKVFSTFLLDQLIQECDGDLLHFVSNLLESKEAFILPNAL